MLKLSPDNINHTFFVRYLSEEKTLNEHQFLSGPRQYIPTVLSKTLLRMQILPWPEGGSKAVEQIKGPDDGVCQGRSGGQ